jgi:hypothetical protein
MQCSCQKPKIDRVMQQSFLNGSCRHLSSSLLRTPHFKRGGAARLSGSIWIVPKCSIYNSPLTDFLFLTTYNPVVFLGAAVERRLYFATTSDESEGEAQIGAKPVLCPFSYTQKTVDSHQPLSGALCTYGPNDPFHSNIEWSR